MDKGPDAFRTISEVADELDIPQHVLRFWETRFTQIRPLKRGGGRRYYRPDDVELIKGIRHLLYGEGYTIKGVQRILKDEGIRFVQSAWREGARLPAPRAEDRDDDRRFAVGERSEGQAGFDDLWEATHRELSHDEGGTGGEPHGNVNWHAEPQITPRVAQDADFAPAGHAPPQSSRFPAGGEAGATFRHRPAGPLTPEGRQRLEAILADLEECRRLLALARRGDDED